MAQQTINIGASPNDGTGTPLRTSFDYTNQNFTELYTALGGGVGLPGATTQVIFNDGGTNLAGDAGLVYNKTTDALTVAGLVTAGSATITGDLDVSGNGAFIGIGRVGLQRPFIPTGQNGTTTLDYRWYSTGTTYVTGARIRASSEAAWSSVSAPTRLMFETVPSGAVGLSERYRISGDGLHTWSNVNNVGGTQMTLDGTGLIVTGATITGDLTVDTSTLKVDSTNNRVGIGTASPGYDLQVNGSTNGRVQVEGASGFGMVFVQASSGNAAQLQLNSSGGSGRRFAVSSNSTGQFSIADETASLARLIIDSSGNVTVSTGNVVMGTANKGIDFSINSDASATSELLNDYEEGTFTPTVGASSGTPTTVTINSAIYTKIGRIVTVVFDFSIVAVGTATGSFQFSLPFNQSASSVSCGAFRENGSVGNMGQVFYNTAADVSCFLYNNVTVWNNGWRLRGTYTYSV